MLDQLTAVMKPDNAVLYLRCSLMMKWPHTDIRLPEFPTELNNQFPVLNQLTGVMRPDNVVLYLRPPRRRFLLYPPKVVVP